MTPEHEFRNLMKREVIRMKRDHVKFMRQIGLRMLGLVIFAIVGLYLCAKWEAYILGAWRWVN